MTQLIRILALSLGLTLAATGAHAACYVEYKAKRDKPLELFFNSVVVSEPCTVASARQQVQSILASQGLTLLKIVSVRKQ